MNQTLGTALAFVFLIGVGVFNFWLAVSSLEKKGGAQVGGWLRLLLALLLFAVAAWFARQLAHGIFP